MNRYPDFNAIITLNSHPTVSEIPRKLIHTKYDWYFYWQFKSYVYTYVVKISNLTLNIIQYNCVNLK